MFKIQTEGILQIKMNCIQFLKKKNHQATTSQSTTTKKKTKEENK